MILVQADGIAWPMETFIASHGFIEIDEAPEWAGHHGRVSVLYLDGKLELDRFAPDLDWCFVRAVAPVDGFRRCGYCAADLVTASWRTVVVNDPDTGKARNASETVIGDCAHCNASRDDWDDYE